MKGYPFPLLVSSLAGRAVVFLFVVSMLALALFVLGNYQEFLDATQLLLLRCLRVSLSLQLIVSLWTAGLLVYRCRREHRRFVLRWVSLALSFCVSSVLLVGLRMLQQWLSA